MKFKYEKEDDVMTIELSPDKIRYAEQTGDLIVHFSPKRKAVLLEILDASKFLEKAAKTLPEKIKHQVLAPILSSD